MPKRIMEGVVVSNKMEKTIVVAVDEKHSHPKYGKIQHKTVKFKAHDENNQCHEGDRVRIVESRPYSKDKTWCLAEVLEQVHEV